MGEEKVVKENLQTMNRVTFFFIFKYKLILSGIR